MKRSSRAGVGDIPDDWDATKIIDLAEVNAGGGLGLTKSDDYVECGYPAYSAGGQDGFVPEAEYERPGVVVSSIGARCGKCFYADGKWTTLANTKVLLADETMCHNKYLWYVVNDEDYWVRSGSAQPFIRTFDVKNAWLPLPPLPEQKKIASILASVDEAIEATEAVIEQTRRVKKGLLQELLTRGIGHSSFKKTAIGEIPEAWDVRLVADLVTLRNGKQKAIRSLAEHPNETDTIPTYGGNGVAGYTDEVLVEEPTTVIGRVGEYCGAVHLTDGPSWISDNAIYVKELSRDVKMRYLALALHYLELGRLRKKTGQPLMTQQAIKSVNIPVPPLDEQRNIIKRLAQLDAVRFVNEEQKDQLKQLKKGLLQDLLTGEVRVGVAAVEETRKTEEMAGSDGLESAPETENTDARVHDLEYERALREAQSEGRLLPGKDESAPYASDLNVLLDVMERVNRGNTVNEMASARSEKPRTIHRYLALGTWLGWIEKQDEEYGLNSRGRRYLKNPEQRATIYRETVNAHPLVKAAINKGKTGSITLYDAIRDLLIHHAGLGESSARRRAGDLHSLISEAVQGHLDEWMMKRPDAEAMAE